MKQFTPKPIEKNEKLFILSLGIPPSMNEKLDLMVKNLDFKIAKQVLVRQMIEFCLENFQPKEI